MTAPTIAPRRANQFNLVQMIRGESPEDLRAAVIHTWASQNSISLSRIAKFSPVQAMLDSANGHVSSLSSFIARQRHITLKQIESVFETVIDRSRRKSQGAVYTPDYIIDYLVTTGIRFAKHGNGAANFCDPACGSGGFLIRAAEILAKRGAISLREVISKHLRGLDNDEWAVEHAKTLLWLFAQYHGSSPMTAIEKCVAHCDSLLATPEELKEIAGCVRGFDLVATNPPYVKLQNLDRAYRTELLKQYPDFANGSFSLALLFLLAGHRMLSDRGVLACITQNNLYTSLAGQAVREYLQSQACLCRIVDFGHTKIFPSASAYTCLVFLGKSRRQDFEFERTTGPVDAKLLRNLKFSSIRHDELDARKWRLAKQPHLDNLRRIESIGIPLGKLTDIRVGFATLKDAVFHLAGTIDLSHGLFRTNDGDDVELAATQRAVKVSEMKNETDIAANQRRIIFPYRRRDGRWTLISETDFADRFPRTYAYLDRHRDALAARDKRRGRYEAWYAWARTQGREAPGPKLLTKTFSARPKFMLDSSDQLFCNGYCISAPRCRDFDLPLMSLQCLQQILNSSVMNYYAKLTSFRIEGNYQCYQKNFIERFGIPQLFREDIKRLESCALSETDAFVEKLYGITREDIGEIHSTETSSQTRRPGCA